MHIIIDRLILVSKSVVIFALKNKSSCHVVKLVEQNDTWDAIISINIYTQTQGIHQQPLEVLQFSEL